MDYYEDLVALKVSSTCINEPTSEDLCARHVGGGEHDG